jgi:hypothetical protein
MGVSVGIDSAYDDVGGGDHAGHGRTSSSFASNVTIELAHDARVERTSQ